MWPFNRGWPLNGGPLNRDSTVLVHVFQNYVNKFKYLSHFKSTVLLGRLKVKSFLEIEKFLQCFLSCLILEVQIIVSFYSFIPSC